LSRLSNAPSSCTPGAVFLGVDNRSARRGAWFPPLRVRCGGISRSSGGVSSRVWCAWPTRSVPGKFIRCLAWQFVRARRLAGLMHWRRYFRTRIAGRVLRRRLGRIAWVCRGYFRWFDRHYRDLAVSFADGMLTSDVGSMNKIQPAAMSAVRSLMGWSTLLVVPD